MDPTLGSIVAGLVAVLAWLLKRELARVDARFRRLDDEVAQLRKAIDRMAVDVAVLLDRERDRDD